MTAAAPPRTSKPGDLLWQRSGGQCECRDQCRWRTHQSIGGRCEARHCQRTTSGILAVLDVVELQDSESQLLMCQGCRSALPTAARLSPTISRAGRQTELW